MMAKSSLAMTTGTGPVASYEGRAYARAHT